MSEPLPVGDFRFLDQNEMEQFPLDEIAANSDTGYIIKCDRAYPDKLNDKHNDYPMAAEHLNITRKTLSPFARQDVNTVAQASSKLVRQKGTLNTLPHSTVLCQPRFEDYSNPPHTLFQSSGLA